MEIFLSDENYYKAVKNATRKKKSRKRNRIAARYRNDPDKFKDRVMDYAAHFKNRPHEPHLINDGVRQKQRYIIVPDIDETIVHHMIVNVVAPIWLPSFYEHSYGSIPGRGPHIGKKRIEKWIRTGNRNVKYCLKMDVRHFFASIPHDRLIAMFAKQIRDDRFLETLAELVNATDVGIPLGFYTSQWIANWYLTGLDHFIKEELHAPYYMRYMDDMVVFGPNKKRLHEMRRQISRYLETELGLELKDDWQVFLFDYVDKNGNRRGRFLDYMGFRFYRDRTTLRRAILLRATRKAKRIRKKIRPTVYDCRQMLSYLGYFDCTDTYNVYRKRIKPHVSFRKLRKQISSYERSQKNYVGKEREQGTTVCT